MFRKLLITFREKICFLLKVVLSLYHANEKSKSRKQDSEDLTCRCFYLICSMSFARMRESAYHRAPSRAVDDFRLRLFYAHLFEPRRSKGPKCHHLDGVEKFVKVGATHSEVPS